MQLNKTLRTLSVLASLGALAAIYFATAGFPPTVDHRIHEAIGRSLGQESLALLRPGGHLTVITRDTSSFPQPAADIALAAFLKVARQAGVADVTVQTLQVDPLRPVQVPGGDFAEWIRRAAVGDVIASFMGPPFLSEEQRQVLGEIKPKVVAFCAGDSPDASTLRSLAEQHLLHAAVLSRPGVPAGREAVEDLYVRVQAGELARWNGGGHPR